MAVKLETHPKCKKEYDRVYYRQNHERLLAQCKQYREQHREEIREKNKEYYQQNHKKLLKQHRLYRNTIVGHLRNTYSRMSQRCDDTEYKDYGCYGGRGIKNKFKSSDEFINYVINDLKVDPRGLQIDRINNNGHYEKGNIRFVTAKVNSNNRRKKIA